MATFRARRPWRFLIPGVLFFYLAYSLLHRRPTAAHAVHTAKTKSFFPPLETRAANAIELDYCQNFPKDLLGHVQVVLKVASGETAVNKAHLSTVSSCIDNLLIVGDREEQLGDRRVIDILADLPKSYETNNVDFQAYVQHHKAHIEGETVHESQRSFKLDRFKYLPMVDRAYTTNPKAKWFVFLESDVYFFWDTLFRLLSQYDPAVPHYFGAPHVSTNGPWFAYGGAGFVMSQGLMKQLIPAKTPGGTDIPRESRLSVRFENWVKEEARGDAVLAAAIHNVTGSKLEALDPTFTSEPLDRIVTNRDRWCVPLLSLHQLSPDQMGELWKWERTRPYNLRPFTYSSLLSYTHSFLASSSSREWWNNLSDAPVSNYHAAHHNAGSCGSECAKDNNCLQWSYSQTVCRFENHIRLGTSVDPENGGQGEFVSGWDTGALRSLGFGVTNDKGERRFYEGCQEATWPSPRVG